MIVKVCGITEIDQFGWLEKHNTEMIGLNFYQKSKRYIKDLSLIEKSTNSKKVGVFVNSTYDEVISKFNEFCLDIVQLHGNESAEFCNQVAKEIPVIKAFGVDTDFSFDNLESYSDGVAYFLFDTKSKSFGGSGRKFEWSKLSEYKLNKPFILSGGITLNDIPEILKLEFKALAGIDVNSGFEKRPGIKDLEKIEMMMKLIKNEKSR